MSTTQLPDELVTMLHSLEVFNLGDIAKTKNQGLPIATFILGTCFIDHLSRIRYFKYKLHDAGRFEKFIYDYFPHEYKPLKKQLYRYLRNTLVHNYSVKGKFYLEYMPSNNHLQSAPNGRVFLNVNGFVNALEFAFHLFSETMINDIGDVRENALAHDLEYPILAAGKG